MPFNLGAGELFLLAAAALLLFGPKKLPDIGKSLGEALGSLKKAYTSALTLDEIPKAAAKNSESEKSSELKTPDTALKLKESAEAPKETEA